MATPALIDLSNYADLLVRSTQGRAGTPDGNVYFDPTGGTIEFIPAEESANVTYPLGHDNYSDGLPEPNPLTQALGLKFEAIYAFENKERKASYPADASGPSEDLRKYDRWTSGTFKFGGAYNFINGRVPSTDADRNIIRGSGWNEYTGTTVNRIYFGVKGLGSIESGSQPYYQAAQYGTASDFNKVGNIDEAVQVFGDASNGAFDNTGSSMYMSIRTYGNNYDRIDTLGTLGIAELGGYSTGAALNESTHLTTNTTDHVLTEVWDGVIGGTTTATVPWTGMSLDKLVTAQTESGFSGAQTGDFTWVLSNTNSGTLVECVAYLDAIAQADDIVTAGEATLNGKQYDTWYEYAPNGKIIPVTGAGDSLGVFIESLPAADVNSVIFYEDSDADTRSNPLEYPVNTAVSVEIGQGAIDDTQAWFHCFYSADWGTGAASDYLDASDASVKGVANTGQPFIAGTKVEWFHDFTGDGSTPVTFLCEGDGQVTQQKATFTIADTAISPSCIPSAETNV